MDVFLIVGLPFAVLLGAFAFVGYSIGGNAASPDDVPAPPSVRRRVARTALAVAAALAAVAGAAAAASNGSFESTTGAGYALEPASLILLLQAVVDVTFVAVVSHPGWSMRRAWVLRAVGIFWLCTLPPMLVLAIPGPDSGSMAGTLMILQIAAVILGAVLLMVASASPTAVAEAEAASEAEAAAEVEG